MCRSHYFTLLRNGESSEDDPPLVMSGLHDGIPSDITILQPVVDEIRQSHHLIFAVVICRNDRLLFVVCDGRNAVVVHLGTYSILDHKSM